MGDTIDLTDCDLYRANLAESRFSEQTLKSAKLKETFLTFYHYKKQKNDPQINLETINEGPIDKDPGFQLYKQTTEELRKLINQQAYTGYGDVSEVDERINLSIVNLIGLDVDIIDTLSMI